VAEPVDTVSDVNIGRLIECNPAGSTAFAAIPFESIKLIVRVASSPTTYDALSNEAVYVYGSSAQRAVKAGEVIVTPVAADVCRSLTDDSPATGPQVNKPTEYLQADEEEAPLVATIEFTDNAVTVVVVVVGALRIQLKPLVTRCC